MSAVEVIDGMDREVRLAGPARRVVSLVPSESASVVALVGESRLVGRTTFCVAPASIASVPTVGGTKDVDVAAVAALAPDLVLANQEENSRKAVEALIAAGLPVHVSFPRTFLEGADYLAQLATMLGAEAEAAEPLARIRDAHERGARDTAAPRPVFVPIWKDPWMTFDARTFANDVLELAGLRNVFADRPRRYPLRADLGRAAPIDPGDRDTRYPRVTLDEVLARGPALALLPNEPFAFDRTHVEELAARGLPAVLVSGEDLFWYGSHQVGAIERLRRAAAL